MFFSLNHPISFLFIQIIRSKSKRQQFFQFHTSYICTVRHYNLKLFRIAKLLHNLSAYPTWSTHIVKTGIFKSSDNGYFAKIIYSFRYCLKKSGPFRTIARCIGSVFNVAAMYYFPRLCQKCGPYFKL